MTKAEIKAICEADSQMQWWAMVLFAEIGGIVQDGKHGGYDAATLWPLVVTKAKEFERLIIERALEKAKESLSLEHRVKRLEVAVAKLQEPTP